jgi:hypothetical protein
MQWQHKARDIAEGMHIKIDPWDKFRFPEKL